jgi:hypothetical protein
MSLSTVTIQQKPRTISPSTPSTTGNTPNCSTSDWDDGHQKQFDHPPSLFDLDAADTFYL